MITQSQVSMWERCPAQYHFRYVQGLKRIPGKAIRGRAFHAAEELNFTQKISTATDLSVDYLKEKYVASLDEEFVGDQDIILGSDSRDGLQTSGLRLVEKAAQVINPTIQPTIVETRMETVLDGNIVFSGQVDVINDNNIIIDLKTAGKKCAMGKHLYELQPPLYSLLFERVTGIPPGGFIYEIVVDKKEPEVQRIDATPTPAIQAAAVSRIQSAVDGMQKGIFSPRPSPFTCGWCGYLSECKVGKSYVSPS